MGTNNFFLPHKCTFYLGVPSSENEVSSITEETETTADDVTAGDAVRRGSRIRRTPKKYGYDEFADMVTVDHCANVFCVTEPSTLKEALKSPNAKGFNKRLILSMSHCKKRSRGTWWLQ